MSIQLQPDTFQHIVRVMNTNVDGKRKVAFAFRMIKGIGVRYAFLCCKKAGIDTSRRAGTLSADEVEKLSEVCSDPLKYKIPAWFLNRKKDHKDGKDSQVISNGLDNKLREDLERLKKIRSARGIRHHMGLRVRGQHTKTTGRRGKVVGVAKKK